MPPIVVTMTIVLLDVVCRCLDMKCMINLPLWYLEHKSITRLFDALKAGGRKERERVLRRRRRMLVITGLGLMLVLRWKGSSLVWFFLSFSRHTCVLILILLNRPHLHNARLALYSSPPPTRRIHLRRVRPQRSPLPTMLGKGKEGFLV